MMIDMTPYDLLSSSLTSWSSSYIIIKYYHYRYKF